jgi:LysR family transcriptional activator of mexEF-oprN operon
MKPIELNRMDLNLLTVLAALMRERHVCTWDSPR